MVQNFVSNDLYHFECWERGHGVHKHVPVDPNEMLRIQDTVFILACCVDNFCLKLMAIILNRLTEGVFDRRIVAVNEVAVDELNCKR